MFNYNRSTWSYFAILITIILAAYILNNMRPVGDPPRSADRMDHEMPVITDIIDISGQLLMQTGLTVSQGDEFIDADDKHYIITEIQGGKAAARMKTTSAPFKQNQETSPVLSGSAKRTDLFNIPQKTKSVVIYHTHTDESYLPTSGTDSKESGGDIIAVGQAFKEALESGNVNAVHSTNNHFPHDINAYHRSRKTLTSLLKDGPDAAFDIHRDAVPASVYHTTINGIDATRVMIVVGRSNPLMNTNLGYAQRIKKVCDQAHPGLIRGIFIGKGDYNQDLYPSALLFEIGGNNNSLIMAERGARSLADAIITAFAETE